MAKWRDELVKVAGADVVREALDEGAEIGSHVEAVDAVLGVWEERQDRPVAQETVDALVEEAEQRDADRVPLVENAGERPAWHEAVGEEVADAMLAEAHREEVPQWEQTVGAETAAALRGEAA